MKSSKLVKFITIVVMTVFSAIVFSPAVSAIQVEKAWGKPTFVHGGGLSPDQIAETREILGVGEDVEVFPVMGEDIERYLNMQGVPTSEMISSVLVNREGDGVRVIIDTPKNITKVTHAQYENAAITAGVTDVTIRVASATPATGESALTGVYKAFDVNGEELEQDRMIVAQEELETTTDIDQNLGEDESNRFNQVIIQIKQEITNYYNANGQAADPAELERIIQEALANFNLENIITQEQIDRLLQLFQRYQGTSAINSQEVQSQLNELGGRVGEVLQEVGESGILQDLWNAIKAFFQELFGMIEGNDALKNGQTE